MTPTVWGEIFHTPLTNPANCGIILGVSQARGFRLGNHSPRSCKCRLTSRLANQVRGLSVGGNMERTRNATGRFQNESWIEVLFCERCGKKFRAEGKRRFCSKECFKGNRRYIDKMGYVVIKKPSHPHATTNGWVREHIVVACQSIGRSLLPGETVHHKDENRQNNAPKNLEVIPRGVHCRIHKNNPNNRKYGEPNMQILCACGCGQIILKYDSRRRPRRYVQGHSLHSMG